MTHSNPWYNLSIGDKFKFVYQEDSEGKLSHLFVELLAEEPEVKLDKNFAYWSIASSETARREADMCGQQWNSLTPLKRAKLTLDCSTLHINVVGPNQLGRPIANLKRKIFSCKGYLLPDSTFGGMLGYYSRDY
jgi:hypothetical protein